MALPGSGLITLSQVNVELARPAGQLIGLGDAGPRGLAGVSSGLIRMSDLHGKSAEMLRTFASRADAPYMSSLFSTAEWRGEGAKRVAVPAAALIDAPAWSSWALAFSDIGGWGGQLTLDIDGEVRGRGGLPNSGNGGDAIWANVAGLQGQKCIINNRGALRAGGAAGGLGGIGGGGQTSGAVREPPSGEHFTINNTQWLSSGDHDWPAVNIVIRWNGSDVYYGSGYITSVNVNGWTYYRGPVRAQDSSPWTWTDYHAVYRTGTATTNTNGGNPGAPGRGQGSDGNATAGANPVAGGAGAGASGKSGDGGAWGAAGQAGATGANGNRTNGLAGIAGGIAGCYINGQANVTLNNSGTLQGRLA